MALLARIGGGRLGTEPGLYTAKHRGKKEGLGMAVPCAGGVQNIGGRGGEPREEGASELVTHAVAWKSQPPRGFAGRAFTFSFRLGVPRRRGVPCRLAADRTVNRPGMYVLQFYGEDQLRTSFLRKFYMPTLAALLPRAVIS